MMKSINGYYRRASKYGSVWVVRIKDTEAMDAVLLQDMTGFGVKDAVRHFNERLKHFGYEITETERDILDDGWGC